VPYAIRVFYLARLADGPRNISRFAKSYLNLAAGIEHDLTIIVKGTRNQFEIDLITRQFSGINCTFELVPDSIGVDIHAYLLMSKKFDNELFCFLNTHSEIVSEGWLGKMYGAINRPNVGLVGAFGSFESINSSWEILYRAQQRFRRGELCFRDAKNFYWILGNSRLKGTFYALWSARRIFGVSKQALLKLLRIPRGKYSEYYEWRNVTRDGATLSFVNKFSKFPNPHIRSNAFLVRKGDLETFQDLPDQTKLAANEFECGKNGLSQFLLDRGNKLIVVGHSGVEYDLNEWEKSDTFRLGRQSNLLIHDNQTRQFASMKPGTRLLHQIFSWGTMESKTRIQMALGTNLVSRNQKVLSSKPPLKCKISVVIPSHNRNDLLDQALFTVLFEPYDHLEIVVFDNASQIPIKLKSYYKDHKQIKFFRSDIFLSVTESWNSAISQATGDYVIFLGDDDGLLPGFFSKINQILDEFEWPDLIMSSLYQFFHPGVLPSNPEGHLTFMELAPGMGPHSEPHLVSQDIARHYVSSSLNTERHFLFQLPGYVIKRDFLFFERQRERVFEPPFPDYFLANYLLWQASKIVASPDPICFQGISKKSFGYTLVNNISGNGFKTLNENLADMPSELRNSILPGSHYWNSYLMTMKRVAESIGVTFKARYIQRYRRLRIVQEMLEIQHTFKTRSCSQILFAIKIRASFFSKLNAGESFFAIKVFFLLMLKNFRKFGLYKFVTLFQIKWSPTAYVQEQIPIEHPILNDNIDLYRYIKRLKSAKLPQ